MADNKAGGVCHTNPGHPKRYQAQVRCGRRGGKDVGISAEVFLSRRARAGPPLYAYAVRRSPQGGGPAHAARHGIQGEEGVIPPMPPDAIVKREPERSSRRRSARMTGHCGEGASDAAFARPWAAQHTTRSE